MAVSNFEKLTIILHKFGIDFNEFNIKFENIETQDATTAESDTIDYTNIPSDEIINKYFN